LADRERYPEIHASIVVAISKDATHSRDLWKGTDLKWRLRGSNPVHNRLLPLIPVVSVQTLEDLWYEVSVPGLSESSEP
jgi:hypothetical protein